MTRLEAVLAHSGYTATISVLGAALRGLTHGRRDLVVCEDAAVPTPPYAGVVLAPWPNRVADGRYADESGRVHQLPVNETERGNALHGLALWDRWTVRDQTAASLRLSHVLHPRPGYPHTVDIEASYALGPAGLALTLRATNLGPGRAPVGLSVHPYLCVGDGGSVPEWVLELPCHEVVETDDRLLPVRTVPVAGTGLDFTRPRSIGSTALDHAFGRIGFGEDGLATARLVDRDGSGVQVTWDRASRWLQAYTLDAPGTPLHARAVALEPMTCAPDAFNSGAGLVVLAPGEELRSWCRFSVADPRDLG